MLGSDPFAQGRVKAELPPMPPLSAQDRPEQVAVSDNYNYMETPTTTTTTKRARAKKEMPLSCQRCRLRKVKCNFAHPCSSCVRLGVECIQVPNDMRKKRPPANYVLTLEKRIDTFQKFFELLQKIASPESRHTFIEANAAAIEKLLGGDEGTSESRDTKKATPTSPSPVPSSNIRPVYGPTSVYDNFPESKPRSLTQKREVREVTTLKELSKDPDVLHCLRLFFTWQYPDHNMFVFREAFLADFFSPKPNSLYCSLVLVLSLCALGARMSDVDTIYQRSISYYNKARSSLLSSLEHPSITSVQSFLLLAFYDICNGNNSTGWMLLGNAMRMGFDLGFQLHPEVWFLKHQGKLKDLDVAIRSRIYWGCFMADHFISLVLGRPSLLKLLDASIPETEDLPELEWIDDYKYTPANATNISDPLRNIINLINISDNMLNDIFTKSDHDSGPSGPENDHSSDDYDLISRLSKLFQYNAQIMKWKENLPADLKWDRESLKNSSDNPSISCVRYYYYILLLCLNRPFVGIVKDFKDNNHLSPAVVCANAIEDLYGAIQKFQNTHGLRRASIFIVYCSILSISVILLTSNSDLLSDQSRVRLKFFLNVLAGCSKTWALAEKSYKMIETKLQQQFLGDPDFGIIANEKKPRKRISKSTIPAENKDNAATNLVNLAALVGATSDQSSTRSGSTPSEVRTEDLNEGGQETSNSALEGYFVPEYQSNPPDLTNFEEATAEFFGGPPVLMTSDLFNEDWEALFPDSFFNHKSNH